MTITGTPRRRQSRSAKNGESGYALLLIFAMAAAIALMLYVELPRVAFEKQRDREQVLIERGEQYKRAIQLYFRKFQKYPPTIEALENTNNVRFLRRRYPDPLTGKDEWRLIHVGPGGLFTDSLTQKRKNGDQPAANLNTFITEGAAVGSALPDNQSGPAGPPRRRSEGGQPQPGSDVGASSGVPGQTTGDPAQQQGLVPGQPGVAPGQMPVPGAPTVGGVDAGTTPGAYPASAPGSPNFPPGQAGGTGQPTADPSQPGSYTPGASPYQAGTTPADLINNLLRQPSRPAPGAVPGMMGGQVAITTPGIAGVASKVEKHSIKVYNEHDKYNLWEFIYDYTKDLTGAGRATPAMGSGDPRLAQQGTQGIGAPGGGQPGTFGMQPGVGGPGGFGAQAGAAGSLGNNSGASASSGSSSGGIGSGFGGSVGSGFGSQPAPTTPAPTTPGQSQPVPNPSQQQPAQQQPLPQPGPIPPPPPPSVPPPDQTENPPQ